MRHSEQALHCLGWLVYSRFFVFEINLSLKTPHEGEAGVLFG